MNITLLTKANSGEENAVAANIISLISKSSYTDEKLSLLITKMITNNHEFTLALNKKIGSDITSVIDALKALRVKTLKAFIKAVYAWTYRLDDELSGQAKKIYEVIKRHGRTMYNLPSMELTSKLKSMYKDLTTSDKLSALSTTGTDVFLTDVKTVDTKLLNTIDERTIDEAEKEELALVTKIRKTVRRDMDKILHYLDSISDIVEGEAFKNLHNEIFDVITEANSKIKARITRKDNSLEEEN